MKKSTLILLISFCAFLINAQTTCPLQNDEPSGAISISMNNYWGVPGWDTHEVGGATESITACDGSPIANNDTWYSFVAQSENSGVLARPNPSNPHASEMDLVIQVFDANMTPLEGLTSDGCMVDRSCFNNAHDNEIERAVPTGLVLGDTYFFRVYDANSIELDCEDKIDVKVKTYVSHEIVSNCNVSVTSESHVFTINDPLNMYNTPPVPVMFTRLVLKDPNGGIVTMTPKAPTPANSGSGLDYAFSDFNLLPSNGDYTVSVQHEIKMHSNGCVNSYWSQLGPECPITLNLDPISICNCMPDSPFADITPPEMVEPADITFECPEDFVPNPAAIIATDNCDDDLEITFTQSYVNESQELCVLSDADGPSSEALSLFIDNLPGLSTNWELTSEGATFTTNVDGSALMIGKIQSSTEPSQIFDLHIKVINKRSWDDWSSIGTPFPPFTNRTYNDLSGIAAAAGGELWTTWDYYELDETDSYLTGEGDLAGTLLNLTHSPSNYIYGWQVGQASNNVNANYGMSSWFQYTGNLVVDGVIFDEGVAGQGIVNTDNDCTPINVNDCDGIIYTWTATDDCGNSTSVFHTIYGEDNTAPTFGPLPENITVECDEIPDPAIISATDNCDQDLTIEYSEVVIDDGCSGEIHRTWTTTDNCGNYSTFTQLVILDDITSPILIGIPDDIVIDCNEDVPAPAEVTATDNCTSDMAVVFTEEETTDGEGNEIIVRNWLVSDNCGNLTIGSQTIIVVGCGNIGDFVWNDINQDGIQDSVEPGVQGVTVNLIHLGPDAIYGTPDDSIYGTEVTDENGYYLFLAEATGYYCIEFVEATTPLGSQFTNQDQGGDEALDSDVNSLGKTVAFLFISGQDEDLRFDAGLVIQENIGDIVLDDLNQNITINSSEFGTSSFNAAIPAVKNVASNMTIFPNPNNGESFLISLVNTENTDLGNSTIEIFDLFGKQVHSDLITKNESKQLITFESKLRAGVYFVILNHGDEILTQKLIVN